MKNSSLFTMQKYARNDMNTLQADPILQLVYEQFNCIFCEDAKLECLGFAAAAKRIRELEHQHRNDEAANRMLSDTCSRQAERIKQLEVNAPNVELSGRV